MIQRLGQVGLAVQVQRAAVLVNEIGLPGLQVFPARQHIEHKGGAVVLPVRIVGLQRRKVVVKVFDAVGQHIV